MAHLMHIAEFDPADHRPVARRTAWTVFTVLFLLMVVDYVDRQVVVSMFPHLKAQWTLSDSQLGALVSVVSVTVALGAVPLSLLADRWSRVKSIFLMALVWSLATITCAFAGSYLQLLGARSAVGLGEAAYGTVGAALIASLFPPRMRSTVLGAFLAGRYRGFGVRRDARRRDRRALGLAGGVRFGRNTGALPRRPVPAGGTRLQDDCASPAGTRRRRSQGRGERRDRRAAPTAHGARHVSRRGPQPARGLDDVGLAAELLQSLLRNRSRQGRHQDRGRRAGRRSRGARCGA